MMDDAALYCRDKVAKEDHRRYLSLLFAPKPLHPALFALYAFNLELAGTRDSVSEPMIGEIRLQWWREALEAIIAGQVREHPVVLAMAKAGFVASAMPDLERMIDARTSDLYPEGPENLGALWSYIDSTGGALAQVTAKILTGETGEEQEVFTAAGSAYAASGILSAMAFELAHGHSPLPQAELGGEGLDPTKPIAENDVAAIRPILMQIADGAGDRIARLRISDRRLRSRILPLVLQAREARAILTRFRKLSYDPFKLAKSEETPLKPMMRYIWAALTKQP